MTTKRRITLIVVSAVVVTCSAYLALRLQLLMQLLTRNELTIFAGG